MDGNGQWNVADIVYIVDRIHAAVYTPTMPAGCLPATFVAAVVSPNDRTASQVPSSVRLHRIYEAAPSLEGNHVYLKQNETDPLELMLCLDNNAVVQAMQVDLVLPAGVALGLSSAKVIVARTSKHALSCLPVAGSDNRYRLLLWSMSAGQAINGVEGPLLTMRLKVPAGVVGTAVGFDSLTAYVEEAVLTGDDLKTLPSITYERPLSFPSILDEETVEVWSEAPGRLSIRGGNLGRIHVFTPDGLLVQTTEGNGLKDRHLTLRPGLYLVEIERLEHPRIHRKVLIP
jgi:hypothetical protein